MGTFESKVRDFGSDSTNFGQVNFTIDTPDGTSITLSARAGNTDDPENNSEEWTDWKELTSGQAVPAALNNHRYLQYQAVLENPGDCGETPTLYEISFDEVGDINSTIIYDATPPTIETDTLTAPDGEEAWLGGSSEDITWKEADITDDNLLDNPITLEYTTDGEEWIEIATDLPNSGTYTWDPVPSIDSNTVRVRITAEDKAGNTASDTSSDDFVIDSSPPTGSVDELDPYQNSSFDVPYTASDDGSGIDYVKLYYTREASAPYTWIQFGENHTSSPIFFDEADPSGTYGFRLVAFDKVGLVSETDPPGSSTEPDKTTIVDLIRPESIITTSGPYGAEDSANPWPGEVTGTASDEGGSGLDRIELNIKGQDNTYWNGSSWVSSEDTWVVADETTEWSYPLSKDDLFDGFTYTITAKAFDRADNVQEPVATEEFIYDTTPPVGSININHEASYTTSTTVLLRFPDASADTEKMKISNNADLSPDGLNGDSGEWIDYEIGPKGWQLPSGDGEKTVYVRFRDFAGNESEEIYSATILLDTTDPVSTVLVPADEAQLNELESISGEVFEEGSGLSETSQVKVAITTSGGLYWNGVIFDTDEEWLSVTDLSGSQPNYTWEYAGALPSWVNDDYTIRVYATDNAGKEETPGEGNTFRFDDTGPVITDISSTSHSDQATWYAESDVSLSWIGDDSETGATGISGYSYVFDQEAETVPDTESQGTGTNETFTNTADGLWYFHVRALDGAGNWGEAAHFTVRVDTTAPTPQEPLFIANGVSEEQIDLHWGAYEDEHAGVKEYKLYRSTAADTPQSTETTDPNIDPETLDYPNLVETINDDGSDDFGYEDSGLVEGWYYYALYAFDKSNPTNTSAVVYSYSKTNFVPDDIDLLVNGTSGPITFEPGQTRSLNLAWEATDPDGRDDIITTKFTVKKPDGSVLVSFDQDDTEHVQRTEIENGYSVTGNYTIPADVPWGNYSVYATTIDTIILGDHTKDSNIVIVKLIPDSPQNASAEGYTSTRIDLLWEAPAITEGLREEETYELQRKEATEGEEAFSQVVLTDDLDYSDTGLSMDVEYDYRLRSYDADDNAGVWSEVFSATTPTPPAPQNVRLVDNSQTSSTPPDYKVFVSWDRVTSSDVPDIAGYLVYRSTDGVVYSSLAEINDAEDNYYLDATVGGSDSYYYRIHVFDDSYAGEGTQGVGHHSGESTPTSLHPGLIDTTPPVISDVSFEYGATWLEVSWETDKLADSRIDYGTTEALGTVVGYSTLVTSHTAVKVEGLLPETTYHFVIRSTDGFGNTATDDDEGSPYQITTTGDTTPPTNPSAVSAWESNEKELVLGEEDYYGFTSPRFEWDDGADPESGVSGYLTYFGQNSSADPQNYQAKDEPNSLTADLTSSGTYYLRIKTRNGVGLESAPVTLFTYKFDITPPTSTAVFPPDEGYVKELAEISGTATDAESGVSGVEISVRRRADDYYLNEADGFTDSGEPIWLSATGTTSWTYDTSGVSWDEGEYRLRTRATDNVLEPEPNEESPASGNLFTVDTTPPTAAISYDDVDALVRAGQTLIIEATFSEPMAESPTPKLSLSGANTLSEAAMTRVDETTYTYEHLVEVGDGEVIVTIDDGEDRAGNKAVSTPTEGETFTVDSTPPEFSDFSATFDPEKTAYRVGDGLEIVFLASEPLAQNPAVTVNNNSASFLEKDNLTYTYTYTLQPNDPDGETAVRVVGLDVAGNEGETTSETLFVVDNTAPTRPTADLPETPTKEDTAVVTGVAEANSLVTITGGDGTATQQLTDGQTEYSIEVTLNQNQENTLYITATDGAGNESAAASVTVLHDNIPPDAAKIDLIAPGEGAHINYATPTFVWSHEEDVDTGSGPDYYELYINGEKNTDDPARIPIEDTLVRKHIITPLSEGEFSWYVVLYDRAGNMTTTEPAAVTVSLDLTRPTSTITHPTTQLHLSGDSLMIEGTATRGSSAEIAAVEVSVSKKGDLPAWVPVDSLSEEGETRDWSYEWSIPGNDGHYFINSRAIDAAGNIEDRGAGIFVTVDKTDPVIEDISETDLTVDSINVNVEIDEPVTALFEYGETEAYGLSETSAVLSRLHNFRLANLDDNTDYQYRITVTDAAGNTTQSENLIFTTVSLDHDPPIITDIEVSVGANTATVTWKTDEVATSQVEYSESPDFEVIESTELDLENFNRDHLVTITELEHNTTYYFRIRSQDESENEAVTPTDSFTTTRIPIINPGSISSEVDENIGGVTITWTSDIPMTSYVEFGLAGSESYLKVVGEKELVTEHEITLFGLMPLLEYEYKTRGENADGNLTESLPNTFTAPAFFDVIPPVITFENQPVSGGIGLEIGVSTTTIRWKTDKPADSAVEYRKEGQGEYRTLFGDPRHSTDHRVDLSSLDPSQRYFFRIKSRDQARNLATSDEFSFTTTSLGLSTPTVRVTATSARVSWTTAVASSSQVEYQRQGTTAGSKIEGSSSLTRNHSVTIRDLTSGRYTYKVRSVDGAGNVAESRFLNFEIPTADVATLTSPQAGTIEEQEITATSARITWTSTVATTSWVDYGTSSGRYTRSVGNDILTIDHVVTMDGLTPGETYYYIVRGVDANGTEYRSQENSFVAMARPSIISVEVTNVTSYTATIRVEVTKEVEASITYSSEEDRDLRAGTTTLSRVHEIELEDLEDGSTYTFYADVVDEAGNTARSEAGSFTTPLDTEGPEIDNVKVDILPIGEADESASIIISWSTNKPATTRVQYDEGIISGRYSKSSIEDPSLKRNHTVIIKDLRPATTYHFRIVTRDRRDNTTYSDDYTFVTPTKERSILQLIIRSLEETFAWVKDIDKFFKGLREKVW